MAEGQVIEVRDEVWLDVDMIWMKVMLFLWWRVTEFCGGECD